jgi:dolichyl-phosphate-mannose-protein mannosyltransferase
LTADRVAAPGVAAGALLTAVLLQTASGAYRSEFGAHPDESAHYVTGVMVREYVASRAPGSPLGFAQEYYAHYPKVAIGHWPPGFYLLQAVWTLPFSPSRVSVLVLMAAFAAALATTLFLTLREELGRLVAATTALLFVALPVVQKASGMVMGELPLALFCFWAVLAFGRFLDQGRGVDALLCALASAAAVLTKGNAFALGLAVPLAVLLARRWGRLRQPALWASAALVVVLCAPWYLLTARFAANNFAAGPPTVEYAWAAARLYTRELVLAGGLGLAVLATVGLAETVARPWPRRAIGGRWAAAAALLLATWLFHCVVPSSREARHMVMALPAFMMFVAAGIAAAARWADRDGRHAARWRLAAVAVAVSLFAADGFAVPAKRWSGFSAAVDLLLRSPTGGPATTLIVSDVRGEGMFISEVARREPRPRRTILRGSKALAESGWNGEGYRLLHRTPAEVLAFLEDAVDVVVLDTSANTAGETHPQLLTETVRRHPDRFQSLGVFPLTRAGDHIDRGIEVWRCHPARRP